MKRKFVEPDDGLDPQRALARALLSLKNEHEMRAFLRDLTTPAELEALCDRWRVIPQLVRGVPYREIHDHTGVSVTTIARVARCFADGAGGYRTAARRVLPIPGTRKRSRGQPVTSTTRAAVNGRASRSATGAR